MRSSRFYRYSSLFTPRTAIVLIAAITLCVAAFVGTRRSAAATPTSGTLSEANPVLTYDAGPFNIPNQSPLGLGQLDQGPRCSAQFPCDNFALTVSLPAGYTALHPNASIKVTLFWTDLGSGQSDYDLYIYRGAVGDLNGSRQADYQAASAANPEVASVTPLQDGSNTYSLKIVPYIPTQEIVHVRMELLSGTGAGGGFPGFGGPDPTAPNAPRYQIYVPPAGSAAEVNNGEFNIGFNPKTGRIMAMNSGPIMRLTPGEKLTPAAPECCEALWEDVSNLTTLVGVDPILWTDQKTGRTFASNSTAGTNVVYGYTDNDGDLWNPLSVSGPNASTDHETIGSGPLPLSLNALSNPVNQGQAVYYCAQTWPVGAAACQMSNTLGTSYGPSVPVYDGQTTQCSGIHGHVKVAPDGTAYLPVRDCSGKAGLMVSVNGGLTWTERIVPNSKTQTHGSDPSVAIGADGTLYFFYVADQTSNPQDPAEGHIHVQVSTDRGATWSKDTDLGASHGVKNAVMPEGVAGDSDRAAVGFLGTDRPGDFEGASFPGIWYLFIATTYDRGNTWTVVNATPNDPVQGAGGIWLGGGSNTNRNLLDFNEVTVDDRGRVIFGYSDGCVGPCVGNPSTNSYTAHMRVARQFGGKGLFASKDTPEPAAPKPACLKGTRDSSGSHLFWKVPDNGGSDIVNYQILRGTAPGNEVVIGQTGIPKASFIDTTADPNVSTYFYVVKAINSVGTGNASNEIALVVAPTPTPTPTPNSTPTPTPDACVSINTLFTDPSGDQQDPVLPQPGKTQLDIRSLSAGQDYRFINSERLTFKLKVDNLNSVPADSGWRVLFDFTPPGGTLTTYYVLMQSDANSAIHYEYGTQSGNLLTTLGTLDEGFYSNDGTVTLALAMSKIATFGPGSTVTNVNAQTEQTTDVVAGSLFSAVDNTSSASYTVAPKNASCVSINQPPPPGAATYVKGGMTFSPSYALRAPVASRDGEPSLRVDRFGNAYVAGIRGVPAGVDLWYFDLNPSSPTYDPYMRNPIYRGQPDQFSPDEAMEVGADGGGDVDLAVGFDEAQPGQPPYLAFSSLVLANVSTARSTDRGATFVKNPVGSTSGGVPVDDRQWMEFYGKNTVYMLYRTVAPTVALVQRSDDGGLTYGPATPVGTIGQVGGIDVDQNDGTVYVSGNTGVVAVGIPPAPGLQPLSYTVHNVTGAGRANIFFTVKVANNGTVYVCYSDGKQVYVKYSKDKGTNWSPEIRISDGPETATSLLPWLETGPTPGSIGVVWYGSSATSNSDDANWKVFFAQSTDITAPNPTVRQVVVSDHFIHGSNISLAGLPLDPTQPSGNRNLIDYFQIGFDPTGAAVIAFTDDHNDFDGHTYVARQIGGPGVSGNPIPSPVEGSGLPAAQAGPKPSVASVGGLAGSQVTDWRHDVRTSNATLDIDDPFDVVSIKYSTEATATGPILVTTMKVSDLPVVPPNGTWRVNFTVNAPDAGLSPTGDYNLGLSDRGDQFFLRAQTDITGAASFVYGTAARRHFVAGGGGGFDYTDRGAATGSFDTNSDTITIKIPLSTLNAALPAGHAPIGAGTIFSGLRGSAFTAVQGNSARSDNTRGGTVFIINSAPVAALTATPTSGITPLAVSFNASGSTDPDAGDFIASYRFNFGDGAVVTQSSSSVNHTYTSAGIYTASVAVTDTNGTTSSNVAQVQITVSEPSITECMEDDDARVGYSGGWHSVNSSTASANHFRMHSGTNIAHFARVNFSVGTNRTGKFSFYYGKSTKGGVAEVFVDGVSRGQVSFVGASGSNKSPDFGPGGAPYEFRVEGLAAGQHTFELRNMSNSVFVDRFCLQTISQPQVVNPSQPAPSGGSSSQSSWSDSGLLTMQGPTTSNITDVNVGQISTSSLNLGSDATAISAVAETSSLVPIKLAVIDPSGLTVQIVDAVNGVAVISTPVSRGGLYTVKVINVGVGPVQVWTLATPTNKR
jgi:PKD repeat protein